MRARQRPASLSAGHDNAAPPAVAAGSLSGTIHGLPGKAFHVLSFPDAEARFLDFFDVSPRRRFFHFSIFRGSL